MQTTIKKGVIALALLLAISPSSCARVPDNTDLDAIEAASPTPANELPPVGFFYSALNPSLTPVPGNFLLDDVDSGRRTMEDPPALPGDGGDDGTNSSGGGVTYSGWPFSTNGLWMQINGITNGIVSLALNNATNQVYAIWSTTNLSTGWGVETEVWPTNTFVMPFTVPVLDSTNSLFFQAQDWTGVTENGNTTPDWWFWMYFGTLGLSDTNLDTISNTLAYDYQNGLDPNIITFSVNTTNRYFNTTNATVQISVSAGIPSYMTAMVDSTNYSSANWMPFDSNFVFNLGSVEGWHSVWVGLRGLPPDAQQTWNQIQLKLVLTPPVLAITNPIAGIVTQPMIEVQGFCPEPLASLTFDVSNAAGLFTNQQAFVFSQYYDTNAGGFTTNTFQAFDVPLTNGDNIVTFHATDQAGNVTITNFTYTLDYSGKTNPPAIQVYWPQNGDQVSGAQFTLRGSLDDFTASLTAQIVDASGNTNTIQGLVERNGLYWVENVPLLAGTNYIMLTAMDVVGNTSTTNLVINCVNPGLTIDDFCDELGGAPRNVIPVVTGTIALTNYTLWVNGIQATQYDDGTWEADSVPLGPGGTAVVEARAIPDSDNGGNGSGTAPPSDGTPSNPTAADSIAAQAQIDQPTACYLQEYQYSWSSTDTETDYSNPICPYTSLDNEIGQVDHVYLAGGTADAYVFTWGSDCNGSGGGWENRAFSWPCDECPLTDVYTDSVGDSNTFPVNLSYTLDYAQSHSFFGNTMPMAEWSLTEHSAGSNWVSDDTESICSQTTLQTGGKGMPGFQNLIEIDVSALSFLSRYAPGGQYTANWYNAVVPPSEITVAGNTPNANGQIFVVLPDNITMDVTPQAPPQRYDYSIGASKYKSYFTAYDEEPKPGSPRYDIITLWGFSAGHAWWCLNNGAPPEGLAKAGISYFDQEFLNQQVGYFSQNRMAAIADSVPGILKVPGNGDRIDAERRFEIGINNLKSGLDFTAYLAQFPGEYILWSLFYTPHDCVTTTIQAGSFSGVSLPNDQTPQSFGIDLTNMPHQ